MSKHSLELLVRALRDAQVQYLIVGGLAVNAHGYMRMTADVDLLLHLDAANLRQALAVFASLGYVPRAPVPMEEFAQEAKRRLWIQQKGMTVFSLFSPQHPETELDLFVEDPLGFQEAYARAVHMEISPGLTAPICSLADLLALKQKAGRPIDLADIENLKRIHHLP